MVFLTSGLGPGARGSKANSLAGFSQEQGQRKAWFRSTQAARAGTPDAERRAPLPARCQGAACRGSPAPPIAVSRLRGRTAANHPGRPRRPGRARPGKRVRCARSRRLTAPAQRVAGRRQPLFARPVRKREPQRLGTPVAPGRSPATAPRPDTVQFPSLRSSRSSLRAFRQGQVLFFYSPYTRFPPVASAWRGSTPPQTGERRFRRCPAWPGPTRRGRHPPLSPTSPPDDRSAPVARGVCSSSWLGSNRGRERQTGERRFRRRVKTSR